ncbi:hypothetical protein HPB50_011679 [Hyalomma asiaticum]|uniref:Uncharacterized protein n=1 Tax=Hyalomma asiaticum TaxID=266040 RepID=A0ACB7SVG8_HYAAI|nr:hypothetical protein HPB50_011679 [Hyalomma asiaticum]
MAKIDPLCQPIDGHLDPKPYLGYEFEKLVNTSPAGPEVDLVRQCCIAFTVKLSSTSPPSLLWKNCLKKGIDGTGTIMANGVRSVRFRSDSEMKQGDLDELTRNDEKVAIVKWKDSRAVLLPSTCAGATNIEPVKRWSKKEKYIDVPALEVVRRYNASLGGVDTCDQLVAVKTKKWTLKVPKVGAAKPAPSLRLLLALARSSAA